MRRLMLAAMQSGSGKTAVTCGLLAALQARGLSVQAFKCGPDYIDPMFHTRVLGAPSRNLDLFLQGEAGVRRTLARQTAEIALLEGAMGYYDGLGGSDAASAWQVAGTAQAPVVLVLRPRGGSLTLAAQVRGMQSFRSPSRIAGLLLNDCRGALHAHLAPILERETGLAVLGYLPPMEEAALESRHLGLLTAGEVTDFATRFHAIARQMESSVDISALLDLAGEVPEKNAPERRRRIPRCRIAVARDEAFCFHYADNLDALEEAGGELALFSPLRDAALPEDVDGLYLSGGYPELYARVLSENQSMRQSVRRAVEAGIPTVAECGGFLYLQKTLQDREGRPWPMVQVLPGDGFRTDRLCRNGYLELPAEADSLLLRAGETVPAHEFHYWDCTENGAALTARKPGRSAAWRCGAARPNLYAAFPHLHFGGEAPMGRRFVEAAARWRSERR